MVPLGLRLRAFNLKSDSGLKIEIKQKTTFVFKPLGTKYRRFGDSLFRINISFGRRE